MTAEELLLLFVDTVTQSAGNPYCTRVGNETVTGKELTEEQIDTIMDRMLMSVADVKAAMAIPDPKETAK